MANTYHAFCQTVFLVSFIISFAYCEEIKFKISSNSTAHELIMRCSLNEKCSDSTDITFVHWIIIETYSGRLVAKISAKGGTTHNDIGVAVSGQLQQSGKERGFLKAVWKYPVSLMNDMYKCEIAWADQQKRVKYLSKEKNVDWLFEYNFNDVVRQIRRFKLVHDAQDVKIAELKKRQDTSVIFTAISNAGVYVADNTNVVFPKVITNVGSGYDKNTGVFTCPVAGYYTFQVYILGALDRNVEVSIMKNGNRITSAAAQPGQEYQTGANGANVWLELGDRVTVTTIQDSKLYGEDFCSFSGHLISPA